MKKSIQMFATVLVMSGMFFTSCKGPTEKEVTTEAEMVESKEALEEENRMIQRDVDAYRASLNERIVANEKSIQDFKERIAAQRSENRDAYEKKIEELNAKNENLKMRMNDFQSDSKEDWEAFKSELDRDMEELGNTFKDFTTKN